MRMNRPSPGWRSSTIVISLFGVGVCAALGMLISVSPFDSSNAAVPAVTAEFENSTLEISIAPIAKDPTTAAPAPALEALPRALEAVSPRVTEGVLERGDTLARSLTGQGVNARVIDRIAREMIGHFDFRRSQPRHSYRLVQNTAGEIEFFFYRLSPVVGYELSRDAEGVYTVVRDEAELWPRQTMVAGTVTFSLYGAITDLGAGPQLVNDFTEVFAYDVDFSRMVRVGDEFRILYERLFRTGEGGEEAFVRSGRILAARYAGTSGEHTAVYFESEEGRGGYYRPDGSSVERQFLMAPVRYARVSSRYSAARRHPKPDSACPVALLLAQTSR